MSIKQPSHKFSEPEFQKISERDIPYLGKYISSFLPYSDYNFLSLLSWNIGENNSYAFVADNLVIKMKDYLSDDYLYLFLGSSRVSDSMSFLVDKFGSLSCVPECVLENIPTEKDAFQITPDRDNFDYVISIENMATLKGNKNKGLRKQVNNFKNQVPNYRVKQIFLGSPEVQDVINLTVFWAKQKGFDKDKIEEELVITNNFLKYARNFNHLLLGVYSPDILLGFTFNEFLSDGWAMGHFGKTDNSIKGSSVFLEHVTADFLLKKGFKYLNHQQDAGLSGLREFKMGYRPVKFLKKYTVTKKAEKGE